jgi:hypothetical protein
MITPDAFTVAVIWLPSVSPESSPAATVRIRPRAARQQTPGLAVGQQLLGRERRGSPRPTKFATDVVNKRRCATFVGCLTSLR